MRPPWIRLPKNRRVRIVCIAAGLVLLGGGAIAAGPRIRALVGHRVAAWKPADTDVGLTANAKEMSKEWEEIDRRWNEGLLSLRAGESARAAAAFNGVLLLDPTVVDARTNLGFCLLDLESWHEAFVAFETALAQRPEQTNAYYGVALALRELGDLEGAVGNLRTYLHLAGAADPFQARAMEKLVAWEDELRVRRAPTRATP